MFDAYRVRLYQLLRWSEQYTKLDMVYLASGSFWQTFGQVSATILSLGLLLLFANFLPRETYGTYRYLISLVGILNIFTLTGMNQAVAQAVATGRDGVLRASVRYQLRWNSLLFVVSTATAVYYFTQGNLTYAGGLLILGLCVPATNALTTYGAYLSGKREFKLNNIYSVLSTALYAAGMAATIFLSGQVVWLIAAYALTSLVSSVIFYAITVRRFNPPDEPLSNARDVLAYGRRLTFIGFINPIAGQIDKVVLNHFWGAGPLAVYAIVTTVVDRTNTVLKSWVGLSYPKLSQKTAIEIDETFYIRLLQGMAVGAATALGYALVSPFLFKYLLPQYLDAVGYSNLLMASLLFNVPGKFVTTVMQAQRMVKAIFITTTIGSALQVALYILWGPTNGIEGLIIAYIVGSGLILLMQIIFWRFHVATYAR